MVTAIRWHKQGKEPRPFVVLTAWTWALPRQVEKHVHLYDSLGWDTVAFYPHVLSLWLPHVSSVNAEALIAAITKELTDQGPRPFVFANFSGATKTCYYKLLTRLAAGQQRNGKFTPAQLSLVKRCCCGQLFDSSPVDFTTDVGHKLLIQAFPKAVAHLATYGLEFTAGLLDFFLLEVFEKDRKAMWEALEVCAPPGPSLFLFSTDDTMADPTRIHALAAALRTRGRRVVEQLFRDSPHVTHLRNHPSHYQDAVRHFLILASEEGATRGLPCCPAGSAAADQATAASGSSQESKSCPAVAGGSRATAAAAGEGAGGAAEAAGRGGAGPTSSSGRCANEALQHPLWDCAGDSHRSQPQQSGSHQQLRRAQPATHLALHIAWHMAARPAASPPPTAATTPHSASLLPCGSHPPTQHATPLCHPPPASSAPSSTPRPLSSPTPVGAASQQHPLPTASRGVQPRHPGASPSSTSNFFQPPANAAASSSSSSKGAPGSDPRMQQLHSALSAAAAAAAAAAAVVAPSAAWGARPVAEDALPRGQWEDLQLLLGQAARAPSQQPLAAAPLPHASPGGGGAQEGGAGEGEQRRARQGGAGMAGGILKAAQRVLGITPRPDVPPSEEPLTRQDILDALCDDLDPPQPPQHRYPATSHDLDPPQPPQHRYPATSHDRAVGGVGTRQQQERVQGGGMDGQGRGGVVEAGARQGIEAGRGRGRGRGGGRSGGESAVEAGPRLPMLLQRRPLRSKL